MLLRGTAEVYGEDIRHYALYDAEAQVGEVIGTAAIELVAIIAERCTEESIVLAAPQNAEDVAQALSGCRAQAADLLSLPGDPVLPEPGDVRVLDGVQVASLPLPDELREEFIAAAAHSPFAAAYCDEKAVSFSYAASLPETLWDISIDTLPEFQRQGHAARAVSWMTNLMADAGKRPVWGVLESNIASANLARKLGFVAVDRIIVFGRD